MLGTLVKVPSVAVVEVLGQSGLDFIVLDAEHAPLDRGALDSLLLAAKVADIPAVVRIPEASSAWAQTALDCGATGILVPHVRSSADAVAAVQMARYSAGRGYSNSPRAGQYGRVSMRELVPAADRQTVVMCQIEDEVAVDAAAEIAAVPGVDCLVVGPADLAVSIGADGPDHDTVWRLIDKVFSSARPAATAMGIFQPDARAVDACAAAGCSVFIVASDIGLLRQAATALNAISPELRR